MVVSSEGHSTNFMAQLSWLDVLQRRPKRTFSTLWLKPILRSFYKVLFLSRKYCFVCACLHSPISCKLLKTHLSLT